MIRSILAFSVMTIFGSAVFGLEVGESVIAIHDADLKIEDQEKGKVWPGMRLKITAINGSSLSVRKLSSEIYYAAETGSTAVVESKHVIGLYHASPVFTDLIGKDPSNASLYHGRAIACSALQKYDKAIADCDEAIRLQPMAEYFNTRGKLRHANSSFDKAIDDYTEAIQLSPDAAYYFNRGETWLQRSYALRKYENYDNAINDFTEAIRLDPNHAAAYRQRGDTWDRKGDVDKAIADFTAAIQINPKDVLQYVRCAEISQNRHDYDSVISYSDEAIRRDPEFYWAYQLRGTGWEKKHDYEKAISDFIKACELTRWENDKCLSTLAAGYAEAGDFTNAIKWQSKALGMISGRNTMTPERIKDDYQTRLDFYKSGKPFRFGSQK